jgi:hypothetical protein
MKANYIIMSGRNAGRAVPYKLPGQNKENHATLQTGSMVYGPRLEIRLHSTRSRHSASYRSATFVAVK